MDRKLENLSFLHGRIALELALETKMLKATWNSTKERFKDHKHILEAYIAKHDTELQQCLDAIQYSSDSNVVAQNLNRLIELLNYNIPLSTDTLKEFESEYTDIDLTGVDLPSYDE